MRAGHPDVSVLIGGLDAWEARGGALAPLSRATAESLEWKEFRPETELASSSPAAVAAAESSFLPRLAGQSFLEGRELPLRREMVSLFVDMVGSTRLVFDHTPEDVLALVQSFMEVVIDVGAYHCGDVHDFEGDGAFLYFEGPGEAVPAAFRLREELSARRRTLPQLPEPRLSLDFGPIVIGVVGTRFRRTISLVGPSIHVAARLLKLAPPGGIIATETIVAHARRTSPELGRAFVRFASADDALGPELGPVRAWLAPDP